jgi:hypothetical protein
VKREGPRLERGEIRATQQGFDASAESVGSYDSGFKPKTVTAEHITFKSSATAQPAFVSIEAGVSFAWCELFYSWTDIGL